MIGMFSHGQPCRPMQNVCLSRFAGFRRSRVVSAGAVLMFSAVGMVLPGRFESLEPARATGAGHRDQRLFHLCGRRGVFCTLLKRGSKSEVALEVI